MKQALKISIFFVLITFPVLSSAQSFEADKNGSAVVVKGTSNLHGWEMNLTDFKSGFQINRDQSSVKEISNITFNCRTKDLKSESSIMDKKAYDAMKANNNPEIRFTGTSVTGLVSEGSKFRGTAKGRLTVAGQTQDVTLPFNGTFNDRSVTIDASTDLMMSSFKMNPPTALMGTLKTGDKITISVKLVYNQSQKNISVQ
jgi:polyisoprenoid-binding protein YceI